MNRQVTSAAEPRPARAGIGGGDLSQKSAKEGPSLGCGRGKLARRTRASVPYSPGDESGRPAASRLKWGMSQGISKDSSTKPA
jgi:hypothetical protein